MIAVEPMQPADWPAVRAIYEDGIATGEATFEASAPDFAEGDHSHLERCRLVAREGADVTGWAALSPVSDRCAYEGVAEVSVYVASHARGRRIGGELLGALIRCSEEAGLWTLQAGIIRENEASRALHARRGFREVGVRKRIGRLDGRWRDVVLLERRSPTVGL